MPLDSESAVPSAHLAVLPTSLDYECPLIRMSSLHHVDMAADMAVLIVADSGAAAVNLTTIARRMDRTSAALVHRFGSTDRLLRIVLVTVVSRWHGHVLSAWDTAVAARAEETAHGLLALLPDDEDALTVLCLVMRFVDWARSVPGRSDVISQLHADLAGLIRGSLQRRWGREPSTHAVETVTAALLGANQRLTDPERPTTINDARETLLTVVDAVRPRDER